MPFLLRFCLVPCFLAVTFAATARPEIVIARTPVPPVLDGKLDDEAWTKSKLSLGEWLTYNPVKGDKLAQTTEVWCTYDSSSLYFAFRCLDPEPGKVKTSISRRDNIFNDDWVGLSLDAMFAGQTSYDMFMNPNGIQADILTNSASGEDVSPDWVWESAGRQTAQGYEVEAKLPLESIRFKSGSEVKMGLLFWRRVSRLGSSASWPPIESGKSVFEVHATAVFDDLNQPRTLELIPSLTYSYNRDVESPGLWKAESKPDAGITVKYGLTSSIAAEATVNPDFSQVESDAFQVEVNQRYPIFFSEKRPFFMEGMNIFSLAGATGDGNMLASVHTRKIVDPLWGLKLTGTLGRVSFGTLSAADESPGRELEDGSVNDFLGEKRYYNIGRALYSLGKGTYVGGIITDTELGNEFNRVAGSDISLRVGEHQSIGGTFLGSTSRSDDGEAKSGISAQMTYGYSSDRINAFSQIEHYDEDFQMDTAFYRRTGISTGWAFFSYNIDPDKKKYPWIRQISPLIFTRYGRDRIEGGHESIAVMGANFRFTRQGFLRVDWATGGREPWAGHVFDSGGFRMFGNAQFLRWLNGSAFFFSGDGIFYDRDDPYQGKQRNYEAGVTFQPTSRISQNVSYSHVDFDRASSGEHIYSVNLINTRSTYQFNRHFSLRAIAQFDSSRYRVLTDFLGSYELVPGTVAYAGYGSLFNRQAWREGEWHSGEGDYLTTRRGFFFKVSYLQRF